MRRKYSSTLKKRKRTMACQKDEVFGELLEIIHHNDAFGKELQLIGQKMVYWDVMNIPYLKRLLESQTEKLVKSMNRLTEIEKE